MAATMSSPSAKRPSRRGQRRGKVSSLDKAATHPREILTSSWRPTRADAVLGQLLAKQAGASLSSYLVRLMHQDAESKGIRVPDLLAALRKQHADGDISLDTLAAACLPQNKTGTDQAATSPQADAQDEPEMLPGLDRLAAQHTQAAA
jgi:hypothetical protein